MNASEAAAQTDGTNERTRPVVLFDGGCPLCRREIGYYQRCRGADQIEWRDVSALAPGETAFGISQREALARFHVVNSAGELESGAQAFATLWRNLPGFRWAGIVAGWRPITWVLERLYRGFLVFRPAIQRAAGRRLGDACTPRG